MVQNIMMGPLWGIIAITMFGGTVTIACFVAMFWFIFRPGEVDPRHVKYEILRRDR
ncbi:MAG TPA: hypothetical protein VF265_10485 [Nevskiaceae bacterium]